MLSFIFLNQCGRGWILLWSPCNSVIESENMFNKYTDVSMTINLGNNNNLFPFININDTTGETYLEYTNSYDFNYIKTIHVLEVEDMCQTGFYFFIFFLYFLYLSPVLFFCFVLFEKIVG